MSRIRTIKPDFFTSPQVAECSPNARLMFVGMWCFCDDAGIHPASLKRIKMEVFPGDDITEIAIQDLIKELVSNGLIVEYEAENERYWQVTGWKKHQKIDKPSYKYPTPDKANSANGRRIVDEQSPIAHPRNGMEGNGMENKGARGAVGEDSEKTEDKPPKKKPFDPSQFPIPEPLNTQQVRDAWADWIEHRRSLRKPMSELSAKKTFAMLAEMGPQRAVAAINHSIASGWTGVFESGSNRSQDQPDTGRLKPASEVRTNALGRIIG